MLRMAILLLVSLGCLALLHAQSTPVQISVPIDHYLDSTNSSGALPQAICPYSTNGSANPSIRSCLLSYIASQNTPGASFQFILTGGGVTNPDGSVNRPWSENLSVFNWDITRTLRITAAPDFVLSTPPNQTLVQGQGVNGIQEMVTDVNGFNSPVSLAWDTATFPPGLTASFTQNPVTSTTMISISTQASTPPGTYTLNFSGSGGGISHLDGGRMIVIIQPQCIDADSTTQLWGFYNVERVASNSVYSFGQSIVLNDYWWAWNDYVQSTVRVGTNVLHSASLQTGYGPDNGVGALLEWYDAPSSAGVGVYTINSSHRWASICGNSSSGTSSASLTVNKPTIGGLPYNNSLWYFGPGTPGAVPITTDAPGTAYQYANLTFNNNCGPSDTCSDTPQWYRTDPLNKISLSCTSCSSPVLQSAGVGTCGYDSAISASIGGLSTDVTSILVNSPRHLVSQSVLNYTEPFFISGYLSHVYWTVTDACPSPGPYAVPSVAYHEELPNSFSQGPGWISGWNLSPQASSLPKFDVSDYMWRDNIGAANNTTPYWNPRPKYQDPPSGTAVILFAPQQWYMGSETPGAGISVFSGTVYLYEDHGDSHE